MSTICHTHFEAFRTRPKFAFECVHMAEGAPKAYTFNGIEVCVECKPLVRDKYDAREKAWEAELAACPDCIAVKAAAKAKAQAEWDARKCAYCGATPSDTVDVSTHSGVEECGACWNWRKLDGPAARHWNRVAKELVSNIDAHDLMTFFPKRIGLGADEFEAFFTMARQIIDKTDAMLDERAKATGVTVA